MINYRLILEKLGIILMFWFGFCFRFVMYGIGVWGDRLRKVFILVFNI